MQLLMLAFTIQIHVHRVIYRSFASKLKLQHNIHTTNTFKNRLDKHWSIQEVLYDFNADLTGTGGQPVCI